MCYSKFLGVPSLRVAVEAVKRGRPKAQRQRSLLGLGHLQELQDIVEDQATPLRSKPNSALGRKTWRSCAWSRSSWTWNWRSRVEFHRVTWKGLPLALASFSVPYSKYLEIVAPKHPT